LPHHHQHLMLLLPLNMAILSQVRWNPRFCFDLISFISKEVEHFFMYLLTICTSSFENSLFNSCVHFFTGMLILWVWVYWVPCRFWNIVPDQMSSWQSIFSHSLICFLSLVSVSFVVQSSLVWCSPSCSLFL
jgi:hypothetical protein